MHNPATTENRTEWADPFAVSATNANVSAATRVYLEVRREIVSLQLAPGTTLGRAEIAARFQVSQSPVREAMLLLEQDGLVVSYPQSRTLVTRIDQERISEEHFLRIALESEVVRRLATSPDDATIIKLRGFLRLQEALVGDLEQTALFKQLDDAFHEALFGGAGQPGLYRTLVAKTGHLARVRSLDLPQKGKMRAVYDGHKQIVDAIADGDAEGAAAAMRQHLSSTIDRIPQLRKAHPEYFRTGEGRDR